MTVKRHSTHIAIKHMYILFCLIYVLGKMSLHSYLPCTCLLPGKQLLDKGNTNSVSHELSWARVRFKH